MNTESIKDQDNIGAFADAFFMLGLLFIGFGYVALLGLYFLKNKTASAVSKNHLKQAIIAATLSLLIALLLIAYILMTTGFASATALILIEVYLMLIIPAFMIVGILAFVKAINHKDYAFPIIGKMLGIKTSD